MIVGAVVAFERHGVDVAVLDLAGMGGFLLAFENRTGRDAAGVERTQRQLRAGLADRLGRHDADGRAFLDHRPVLMSQP